jgi:hypothetical protein
MAQVQGQVIGRQIPFGRMVLGAAATLAVAFAIYIAAVLASGSGMPSSPGSVGQPGTPEWVTFRAGERGSLHEQDALLTPNLIEYRAGEREPLTR